MSRESRRVSKACAVAVWVAVGIGWASHGLAEPPQAAKPKIGPEAKAWQASLARGIEYLRRSQAADGSYSAQAGPAVTALVVKAVLQTGQVGPDEPFVAKALRYLKGFVQEDGGIYGPESIHRNYESALGLLAFQAANRDGRYAAIVKQAEAYLKKLQWDEEEGHDRASAYYGGAGYGSKSRPDLSNTQFLMDALAASGVAADDPVMQKALVFVSRCQNLESEHNTLPFAVKINDGGFYYTPAAGGQSMAGTTDEGGLRSYGSMTY
ncbi:MAG: terpene cyclase/mutase family protein, partial [Planctomycetes bacterium]|nr:terpene cyclase/mutase family protein [Planctomycetota bacterium]